MENNKRILDFAEFVKQIKLDDNGAMTNLEYYDYKDTCWHKMSDMSIITYVNFAYNKLRIKPKPKMRAMDFRDADKLIGQVATYCNNDITLYYVVIDACYDDKIGAAGTTLTYDEFHEFHSRPDGSKFEVEDV